MSSRQVDHVTHAVRTLLDREGSFNPRTREIFWESHLSKVFAWVETMKDLLVSKELRASPDDIAILEATIEELDGIRAGVRALDPAAATDVPDAVRALVFSNVIAYIATAYDGPNGIQDQWRIYLGVLENLGR